MQTDRQTGGQADELTRHHHSQSDRWPSRGIFCATWVVDMFSFVCTHKYTYTHTQTHTWYTTPINTPTLCNQHVVSHQDDPFLHGLDNSVTYTIVYCHSVVYLSNQCLYIMYIVIFSWIWCTWVWVTKHLPRIFYCRWSNETEIMRVWKTSIHTVM